MTTKKTTARNRARTPSTGWEALLRYLAGVGVLDAEVLLEDFASAGFWENFYELDVGGAFVAGEQGAGMGDELGCGDGLAGLEDDEGLGDFAPALVGDGDDGGFKDGGVGEEGVFDFERRDVFTAGNDDVLLAVDEGDVAGGVDGGHVTGMEPAVAEGFGGGLGLVPIAEHDAVAASYDFTDGDAILGEVVVVGVNDGELGARHSVAGEGLGDVAGVAGEVELGLIDGAGEGGTGFGEAVAGVAVAGEGLFHLADEGGGRGGTADSDRFEAGEIVVLAGGVIDQDGGHDGDGAEVLDAFSLNEAEELEGVKGAEHDVLAAEHGEEVRDAPAVGVEEGDGMHFDGAVFNDAADHGVEGVEVNVAMGEGDTLGAGAGAGGVEDFADGVLIYGGVVGVVGGGGGEEIFVGLGGEPGMRGEVGSAFKLVDGAEGGGLLAEGGYEGEESGLGEEDGGAGVGEDVGELRRGEADVEGEEDGAGVEYTVVGLKELVGIGGEEGYAVAGLDACGEEGAGEMGGAVGEFGVGGTVVAVNDGGA